MMRRRLAGHQRPGLTWSLALGAAVASLAAVPAALLAPTTAAAGPGCSSGIEVTTNADAAVPPAGSLRQAIMTASGGSGAQVICIDTNLPTIVLSAAASTLAYSGAGSLTIQGNGNTIQGDTTFTLLSASSSPSLTVDRLTLTKGGGGNGAIFSNNALTVTNSTLTANTSAGPGGAVETLNGLITITNSTFTGNTAGNTGGAAAGAGFVITNSTFATNTALGAGGGAIETSKDATVTNSTFVNNQATHAFADGGAIDTSTLGDAITLKFDDFVGNTAARGNNISLTQGSSLTLYGTVLMGGATSCSALVSPTTFNSQGFNFSDDTDPTMSCHLNASTDRIGAGNNPLLGSLAGNGGPTQTLLPQTGSPLIDAIPLDPGHCTAEPAQQVATDQRLLPRPSGSGCEIGAVEVQVAAPIIVTPRFTG